MSEWSNNGLVANTCHTIKICSLCQHIVSLNLLKDLLLLGEDFKSGGKEEH